MNLGPRLMLYTKTPLKQIVNIKVKHKTIKLLDENIGENLWDLEPGKEFLDLTPKA